MQQIILLSGILLLYIIILQARKIRRRSGVKLLLPKKIYASPGIECNIYFDNIVTVINPANYVFEVNCETGRNDAKRWRFTPRKEDAGTYKWSLRVIGADEYDLIAEPIEI